MRAEATIRQKKCHCLVVCTRPGSGLVVSMLATSNTCGNLTHTNLNSNNFTTELCKIAKSGLLEHVSFEQWHVIPKVLRHTRNAGVAQYAAILAAFACMGKYGFEISQNEMAAAYARHYECPIPSRQTISNWESCLEKIGFLQIPRHVNWRSQKTKVRVFTKQFWEMARIYAVEKLSYICPHATEFSRDFERKEHLVPKERSNIVNYETTKRARDVNKCNSETPSAAHADRVEKSKKKETTAHILDGNHTTSLKKYGSQKKPLPKLLQQILHCIMTKSGVRDQLAGVLFFADLYRAEKRGDEIARQLFRHWPDLTHASKPGMINQLLAHMRKTGGGTGLSIVNPSLDKNCPTVPGIKTSAPWETCLPCEHDLHEMITALCMETDYEGPYREQWQQLQNLPADQKMAAIESLLNDE